MTGVTGQFLKDSGKIPCRNNRLMVKLKGFDKTLTLPFVIVTGIPTGPKTFPLCIHDVIELQVYFLLLC